MPSLKLGRGYYFNGGERKNTNSQIFGAVLIWKEFAARFFGRSGLQSRRGAWLDRGFSPWSFRGWSPRPNATWMAEL